MPQLDFSSFLSQIIWLAISFCALYCLVQYYFLPRLESVIGSRNYAISQDIKAANVTLTQVHQLQSEISNMLDKANDEVHAIRIEAEQQIKHLIAESTAQTDAMITEYSQSESSKIQALQIEARQHMIHTVQELQELILQLLLSNSSTKVIRSEH